MTIEQTLVEKVRTLPVEKQLEVLDFAEFLQQKAAPRQQRILKGAWADLKINLTEEDIAEVRQEMWANFPRDIEP